MGSLYHKHATPALLRPKHKPISNVLVVKVSSDTTSSSQAQSRKSGVVPGYFAIFLPSQGKSLLHIRYQRHPVFISRLAFIAVVFTHAVAIERTDIKFRLHSHELFVHSLILIGLDRTGLLRISHRNFPCKSVVGLHAH